MILGLLFTITRNATNWNIPYDCNLWSNSDHKTFIVPATGWKSLPGTHALTYMGSLSVMEKSFVISTLGGSTLGSCPTTATFVAKASATRSLNGPTSASDHLLMDQQIDQIFPSCRKTFRKISRSFVAPKDSGLCTIGFRMFWRDRQNKIQR